MEAVVFNTPLMSSRTFPPVRSVVSGSKLHSLSCFIPSPGKILVRSRSRRNLSLRVQNSPSTRAITCGVTEISHDQFSEVVLRSDRPVLVEFVANWCGPCRLISKTIEWAAEEYKEKMTVVKIDHDANPGLIEEFKVYGLPTLILFKNGQMVPGSKREGAITKVKLQAYIDDLLEAVSVS